MTSTVFSRFSICYSDISGIPVIDSNVLMISDKLSSVSSLNSLDVWVKPERVKQLMTHSIEISFQEVISHSNASFIEIVWILVLKLSFSSSISEF